MGEGELFSGGVGGPPLPGPCSIVHTELMLIHPFRDGNGRAGRLLATLMGLQAKLPPLDFSDVTGKKRQEYFRAVQAGVGRDYEPMEKILSDVVRRTRRAALRAGLGRDIR